VARGTELLIETVKNVSPRGLEAPPQTIKVIHGHIPLTSLYPLQGSTVNVSLFGKLFLSEIGGVA
jgi:hypothetical protein